MRGWHKKVRYNKNEDAASPTVATESVLITAAVGAHEGRDVEKIDTSGTYLHTETDEDVTMFLEVVLDELMVKVASNIYQKYVIMSNKGKPLLYIQIKKGIVWNTMQCTTVIHEYGEVS